MVKDILTYLQFGNRYHALEIVQLDSKLCYMGITLKKKKGQLNISGKFKAGAIEDPKHELPKGKPFVIVANTDAVLTKQLANCPDDGPKLVGRAFPNIELNEFYYQCLKQGSNWFVSICRKDHVNGLLDECSSSGLSVIDVFLGNLPLGITTGFIAKDNLFSSNARITKENSLIESIETEENKVNEDYDINGLQIGSGYLLSCSAALGQVIGKPNIIDNLDEKREDLVNGFRQGLFFGLFLKFGLGLLFLALLVNTFFFFHYQQEIGMLHETSMVMEVSRSNIVELTKKVEKSKKRVDDLLRVNSSKSSFYANEIISGLPESILLSGLDYQPVSKRIKEGKPIELAEKQIIVTGTSSDSQLFSYWVASIEKSDWASSVEISGFKDISGSSSEFTIKINLR